MTPKSGEDGQEGVLGLRLRDQDILLEYELDHSGGGGFRFYQVRIIDCVGTRGLTVITWHITV